MQALQLLSNEQMMKISWISSPLAIAFAQKFLAPETWVPFFNLIAFVFGTCELLLSIRLMYRLQHKDKEATETQEGSRVTQELLGSSTYRCIALILPINLVVVQRITSPVACIV